MLGIKGAFWEKNVIGGGNLAFMAHTWFKIILFYQNLWHLLGSNNTWLSTQKIEKIAHICLNFIKKNQESAWKTRFAKEYPLFFEVFVIKRILHYNRAILHWIITKKIRKYMKNTFCDGISMIFDIFHKTYFTL